MGRDHAAAGDVAAPPSTTRSSPSIAQVDAGRLQPGLDRREPVRFLDAQLLQAAHPRRRRVAKEAATASTGYSSIIDGARSGGTVTPFSAEARTRRVATASPPSLRLALDRDVGAHLAQRRQQAAAQRVRHHAFDQDVGARHDQRRHQREGGRGRIGRHHDRRGLQFGLALQHDPPAMLAFAG